MLSVLRIGKNYSSVGTGLSQDIEDVGIAQGVEDDDVLRIVNAIQHDSEHES